MDRNQSFSIKPSDSTVVKLLTAVKQHCKETGITYSHVIVQGLKLYMEKLNGKVQ